MSAAESAASGPAPAAQIDVESLLPILRRVVGARVANRSDAEDLVQEAVTRVLASADRISEGQVEAYAITTARNLVASMWRDSDRFRRHEHRLVDHDAPDLPDATVLSGEDRGAMARALASLPEVDRDLVQAHEMHGRSTAVLAAELGSTPGAVAARLHRLRARLRMEYLVALDGREPPTVECRKVLTSLSQNDRRRQREAGAERHLLECPFCAQVGERLREREPDREGEVQIPVSRDADVVTARQSARSLAAGAGFAKTDLTVLATAVSEVARNIVKFAGTGHIVIELVDLPRLGVRVTAMDAGPGIPDVDQAMADGFSTYHGLGLGLPGARRLMDEFDIESELGRGTTITMTKWKPGGTR